ncbi:hypothetical protein BJX65DRAFT_107265 [Aspergillus insuetus]
MLNHRGQSTRKRYGMARCQFCGISFNIARRRKVGEPDVASWRFGGDSLWGYEEPVEDLDLSECKKQGCALAIIDPEEEDDLVNDPDFVPSSEDWDEWGPAYESNSGGRDDDDSLHISNDGDMVSDEENKEKEEEALYRDFLTQIAYNQSHFSGEPVGPFVYTSSSVS